MRILIEMDRIAKTRSLRISRRKPSRLPDTSAEVPKDRRNPLRGKADRAFGGAELEEAEDSFAVETDSKALQKFAVQFRKSDGCISIRAVHLLTGSDQQID